MMFPHRARITEDHLKLLRRMYVGWTDCEYGAPEINPKRPYGNSSVALDIAEILGWPVDDEDGPTDEQRQEARRIHEEMRWVLQIVLQCAEIRPGTYLNVHRAAPYGTTYAPEPTP